MKGIHRWPANSLHKGPVTREMFPFGDVIMWELFKCSGSVVVLCPCLSWDFVAIWNMHDHDVITWKPFPRYWPFVREIRRSPGNSPHKGPVIRNLMAVLCEYATWWRTLREILFKFIQFTLTSNCEHLCPERKIILTESLITPIVACWMFSIQPARFFFTYII